MKRTALSAALATAFTPVMAQEPDPEIAALTRPESFISVGAGYWTKDRPKLGTYDGMSRLGAYGLVDFLLNTRDPTGTWFILDGRDLGLETRELRMDWLRQGSMGVFLEYNRLVRDEPNTVKTAVSGIGTTTLTVLMGTLRLVVLETALSEGEEVIHRQRLQLLEVATPVIKLWDGIVAVPSPGLGEGIVFTAWQKRLTLPRYDETKAAAFIDAFRGRGPENAVR